jgi:ABC-2 type transport system permease protein
VTVVLARLVREQRVRLPLVVAFAGAWGFLLVALFATADAETQSLQNQPANLASAFRLAGLDPLAAWVSLGQVHPLFLLACGLLAIGLGVRAVAGELEAGTLELTLARPLRRSTYLAAHVALLVPGALAITVAYAAGAVVADRAFDPPGDDLHPGRMAAAALLATLLVLCLGGIALLASAWHSERGRALGWAIGVTVAMYAVSFLFPLWEPLRPLARLSLFWYFSPGPTIQEGRLLGGDALVLAAIAAATISAAFWRFGRRDLAA